MMIRMLLSIVWAHLLLFTSSKAQAPSRETVGNWLDAYVGFEQHYGQVKDFAGQPVEQVLFQAKLPGYGIFVTDRGVHYVLYQIGSSAASAASTAPGITQWDERPQERMLRYARIDVNLLGARIDPANVAYEDPLPGYTNYYSPAHPDGILGVRTYRKVRLKEVYPGIEWVWKYENGVMHHEFEVRPGADVEKIRLKVKWADVKLAEGGKKIVLATPLGKLADGSVVGYSGGNTVEVSYQYDGDALSYDVRDWNGKEMLVIDPPLALVWATYYGGSNLEGFLDDWGPTITTDANGNVFVTGLTLSLDFPTQDPGNGAYYQGNISGNYDAFVLKFDNNGVRQWATYYGGTNFDRSYRITTDANGNLFVTGETWSEDFPTYDPGGGAYYDEAFNGGGLLFGDAFILKFDNNGVRQWATYYGGNARDEGWSITTDANGNVFVTGITFSPDFPTYDPGGGAYYDSTLAGPNDAFVLKFDNNGVRLWATYYGGSDYDDGTSITTDTHGNVFVTGKTASPDFATQDPGGGAYYDETLNGGGIHNLDSFILKFDNMGVRQWATYYGGAAGEDWSVTITADASGNIFVTGLTEAYDFPTYNPGTGAYYDGTYNGGEYDAFILKFDTSGTRLWATYYGGGERDDGFSIITDTSGNVFVTGLTASADFPTYDPGGGAYYDGTYNGGGQYGLDLFILQFDNSGVRQWATYYGGSGDDYGGNAATDINGNLFVVGSTESIDLPTYDPGTGAYYDGTHNGSQDAFILKFEGSIPTGIARNEYAIPERFSLHPNYPNPFHSGTNIVFDLPEQAKVKLKVYDLLGREVATLVEGSLGPGSYAFDWDGRDEAGKLLPSGMYLYRLEAAGTGKSFVEVRKMVLLQR